MGNNGTRENSSQLVHSIPFEGTNTLAISFFNQQFSHVKFLKQFLSELTQTGGRFGARDFDLNQTRGKHSSSLNFPFAKACPLLVLLAAEVAAPRRDEEEESFSSFPLPLSTFFPLSFNPLPTFSSYLFSTRRHFLSVLPSSSPGSSQQRSITSSAFDLVAGGGGGEANPHQTNRLQKTCRREPDEILLPIHPRLRVLFLPLLPLPIVLVLFQAIAPVASFLARRHGGEGATRQESKDPERIGERESRPSITGLRPPEKLLYSSRLMVNGHGFVHPFSSSASSSQHGFLSSVVSVASRVDRATISPINSRRKIRRKIKSLIY